MRCACCDDILHEPKWNRDHQMWDYCPTCLEIIFNVFEDYPEEIEEEEVELISDEEFLEEINDLSILLDKPTET